MPTPAGSLYAGGAASRDQLADARLALAIEARLLDQPDAELLQRLEERVHLVERVLEVEVGLELELQVDPVGAVRELER
jgi:hypothetical protein